MAKQTATINIGEPTADQLLNELHDAEQASAAAADRVYQLQMRIRDLRRAEAT
jgi:hypothetical protein